MNQIDNWAHRQLRAAAKEQMTDIHGAYLVQIFMITAAETMINEMQEKIVSLQESLESLREADVFVFNLQKAANDAVGVNKKVGIKAKLVSQNPKWDMQIADVDVESPEAIEITLYCTRESP